MVKARATRTDARVADKKAKFLEALAECRSITAAAKSVGVGRRTVYDWRDRDPEFDEAIKDADGGVNDMLVQTAVNLALFGAKEDVFYRGEVVGTRTIYFPQVLTWLIERRVPEYQLKNGGDVEDRARMAAAVVEAIAEMRSKVPAKEGVSEN